MYCSVNCDRHRHLCNCYYSQGIDCFHHLGRFLCLPLQSLIPFSLMLNSRQLLIWFLSLVFPAPDFHVNTIAYYVLFQRDVFEAACVIVCLNNWFLFTVGECSLYNCATICFSIYLIVDIWGISVLHRNKLP